MCEWQSNTLFTPWSSCPCPLRRRRRVRRAGSLALDHPAAACFSAAVRGRFAFGERTGHRLPRLGADGNGLCVRAKRPLHARCQGFDMHAAVSLPANRRDRLDRLCRYFCRPPLSHNRLTLQEDGRIALELKTPFSDGSTHILVPVFLEDRGDVDVEDADGRVLFFKLPANPEHELQIIWGIDQQDSHDRPFNG